MRTYSFPSSWSVGLALAAVVGIATGCRSEAPKKSSPSTEATSETQANADPPAEAAPTDEATELKEGDPAPDITVTLHDGKEVSLAKLRGRQVVVYFYPKDDTPGCRVEAQGIKHHYASFEKAKIEVLGVSTQDAASHQSFIDKEELPFPLVVDSEGAVAKAFGVPVEGDMAARQTFLIGRDGKIKKVWRDVNPSGHAEEILAAASS